MIGKANDHSLIYHLTRPSACTVSGRVGTSVYASVVRRGKRPWIAQFSRIGSQQFLEANNDREGEVRDMFFTNSISMG